jgi:hypothetical protein
LSTYISNVKSAPEDAKTLLAEVTALCSVLEDLVKFLRYDFKGNFTPTSTLYAAILACQKKIQNLSKKLDNLQGRSENKVKGIIKRVVEWPLRKDEYQSTLATLQRFAQTFQFSLPITNWLVIQL